jgi:glutamate synthase (NADPH/NADH) small chain
MADPKGFLNHGREVARTRPVGERVKDWNEVYVPGSLLPIIPTQASRCMDCGIPFCHNGCPLGNLIPEWNDYAYREDWSAASERLHATNNFPEFTGAVCPAPCETACVLGITDPPVAIKQIEKAIAAAGWEEGWVVPEAPAARTDKKVAVIGSGPAGMAAAQQLNRAGHTVTVYERDDRPGGLLMYGIPDFKLAKDKVWNRVKQMEAEGVTFKCSVDVGKDITGDELRKQYDAVLLAIGATKPRDLPVPGRELDGIHFAMQFLPQQNKANQGDTVECQIKATGKHVVVIGGGDTGSDCIGTSIRQGAASVTQIELLDRPAEPGTAAGHNEQYPWPYYPMVYRTSTSQAEGADRKYSIMTKSFGGEDGMVKKLHCVELRWVTANGRAHFEEVPGSEFEMDAELVLLAMGFLGPETGSVVAQLGCALDNRGNVIGGERYETNVEGVFSAGDGRRGQSLVVWALAEGREAARGIDEFLMGHSDLPTTRTREESLPRYAGR